MEETRRGVIMSLAGSYRMNDDVHEAKKQLPFRVLEVVEVNISL
jgi:hypothetical protein